MSIPLGMMKQDVSGLVQDWGVSCRISRFSGSENAAGKMSGAFVSVSTQTIFIQPYDRRRSKGAGTRDDWGLLDETTHEAFWHFSGYAMQPEDRLAVSGQSYVYDVLSTDQPQIYRHAWLKVTARS